ncbi:MAG: hypothetical protein KGS72_07190 [Cyanobacteria bacterium REEB67]|nr:hypothetical protein [Cyanobacteria bacterium REEB67]
MVTNRKKNHLANAALAVLLAAAPLAVLAETAETAKIDPAMSQAARALGAAKLLEESNSAGYNQPQEALRLILEAEAIMPPKYSREEEIRNRVIELEQQLSNQPDLPGLDEKTRQHYRVDVLKRLREAAAPSAATRREQAYKLAALSGWELNLGLLDDADEHYRQALELGWRNQHARSYHDCTSDNSIIQALLKAGREKQAESLLLFIEEQYTAHAQELSLRGETNCLIGEQTAKRFDFLAERNRFDEASALLKDMLSENSACANNELSRYYLFNQLNETFEKLAKSGDIAPRQKALEWTQQLLNWQLKHYDDDDYRLCNTKLEQALLYEKNNYRSNAFNSYSAALISAIKYGAEGEKYTRAVSGLKRLVTALKSNPGENKELLASIEKTLTAAEDSADKIRTLNAKQVDIKSETELSAQLAAVEKLAPYSTAANNCFAYLSGLYEKNQNWAAKPDFVSAAVQYQRHTSPVVQSGCWAGNPWSYTNRGLILLAVKALLNTSTPTAASNFLEKQMLILKDELTFDDYANEARAVDLIGDRKLAIDRWKGVIDRTENEADTFTVEREAIPALEKLQATAEVKQGRKIVTQIRNESNQRKDLERRALETNRRDGFLPAPLSDDPYAFNYAVLTKDALTVGKDARLLLYDGASQPWCYSFAGSFGTVQISEPVLQSGSFKFIYHGGPDTFGPPSSLLSNPDFKPELVGIRFFYGPPAIPRLPLAPPPAVPAGAIHLNNIQKSQILEPGNYIATSGIVTALDMLKVGQVRLFLTDAPSSKTGLTIAPGGRINGQRADRPFDANGDNVLPIEF